MSDQYLYSAGPRIPGPGAELWSTGEILTTDNNSAAASESRKFHQEINNEQVFGRISVTIKIMLILLKYIKLTFFKIAYDDVYSKILFG